MLLYILSATPLMSPNALGQAYARISRKYT